MPTLAAVEEYRKAQRDIVSLSERELRLFLLGLEFENVIASTNALEIFMPALIAEYGDMTAAVAVDFYDEIREGSQATKPFKAIMGDLPDEKAIQASTRWAVGPLFQEERDIDTTIKNLTEINDRFVKQSARNTIFYSTDKDPSKPRYARVPSGAHTCKFCLMLASRGAVYANTKTAGQDGNSYHGHCDCQVIPMFDGDEYPKGYDPDELYDQYVALEVAKQGH